MRATYAGVSVDLGEVAWLFDVWASRPVFHASVWRSDLEPDEDGATAAIFTRCGIATRSSRRGGTLGSATALPPKHARRFARPCLHCWPELRSGQLELKAGPPR